LAIKDIKVMETVKAGKPVFTLKSPTTSPSFE
jgi:hypothetical protein